MTDSIVTVRITVSSEYADPSDPTGLTEAGFLRLHEALAGIAESVEEIVADAPATLPPVPVTSIRTPEYAEKSRSAADPCFRCGRDIKADASLWIQLGVDGKVYPAAAVLSEYDSQGLFPIGADCARKLRGYVIRGSK